MPKPIADDIQELIAGYILGDLTLEEATQLEQLTIQDPAVLRELQAMQTSFALLPHGLAKTMPPATLRQAIAAQPPDGVASPPLQRRFWPKAIAGMLALIVLALATDNLRLRRQLQLAQAIDPSPVANILQQPSSRLVALEGAGDMAAVGTLLFTPGRWQEVVIAFQDLPPLPPEQIYRMWLTLENGTIIFCGEFNTDARGSVFLRLTPPEMPPKGVKATGLFVTLDTRANSPDPGAPQIMQGAI